MENGILVAQLLTWISEQPRDYRETIEAWRTSCPRLTVWEEAMDEGLIERIPGASLADARIRVTDKGRLYLGAAGQA